MAPESVPDLVPIPLPKGPWVLWTEGHLSQEAANNLMEALKDRGVEMPLVVSGLNIRVMDEELMAQYGWVRRGK